MHSTSGACRLVDLPAALALALVLDAPGERQRLGEDAREVSVGPILRAMSRITRPSIVRMRLSARFARLNCLAWA